MEKVLVAEVNVARNDEYVIFLGNPLTFYMEGNRIYSSDYDIEFIDKKPSMLYDDITNELIKLHKEHKLKPECKVYKREE